MASLRMIVLALVLSACGGVAESEPDLFIDSDGLEIPQAPVAPTGPLAGETAAALDRIGSSLTSGINPDDIAVLTESGDARLGWVLADLLRFYQNRLFAVTALEAFTELSGADLPAPSQARQWRQMTDYLIAWDTPAPPDYAKFKERLFTLVEPGWQQFFDDDPGSVDWRLISWGGVLIDDRPLGDTEACVRGCIPALDDPPVTTAAEGSWYPDDAVIFGVTVNGESRAYPKNMMEVHEMVNDTLGGRRIGMPYCTLCGAAQAFYTDVVPDGVDTLVLRTSGLLSRSNKVMYDLGTGSMFDTFLGLALTGPLYEAEYTLEPVSVVTSTWGEWKTAHPETTIVAEDGGRGIIYPADPLRGRDDNGPIFPVGEVDPRLPVQDLVLGVIAPDGTPVAFPVVAARVALGAGEVVELAGVQVQVDAGGLTATDESGALASHQAFWFAWSQFYPDTIVWNR